MPSYRRVIRAENSSHDDGAQKSISPKKNTVFSSSRVQKIFSVLSCLWISIRILWYWIERIFLILILCSSLWWLSLKPSLLRDWNQSESLLSRVSFSGSIVQIDNIRDFRWKSSTGFVEYYRNETYNTDDLIGLHYIIVPFGDTDAPSHTMLSFSFSGGKNLVISPEIRKERGESFDGIRGLLNQYEFVYILATEDDAIRLRTNIRKNAVYMYPIHIEKGVLQELFHSFLVRADKLSREPEFYNTIWNNCTTSLLYHANALRNAKLEGGYYTLFPSHSDTILYNNGLIETKLPLPSARSYYRVDPLAQAVSGEASISPLIRKSIQ